LIRKELHEEWSSSVHQLVGAWDDFPEAQTLRNTTAKDNARYSSWIPAYAGMTKLKYDCNLFHPIKWHKLSA